MNRASVSTVARKERNVNKWVMLPLAVAFALCLSSCTAERYRSSLRKPMVPVLPEGTRYRIAKFWDKRWDRWGESSHGKRLHLRAYDPEKLTKAAAERYPGVFSTGQNAFPIEIALESNSTYSKCSEIMFDIVLCGSLSILPAYRSRETKWIVTCTVAGDDGIGQRSFSDSFSVRQADWATILSPLGLLHVHGRADYRCHGVIVPEIGVTAFPFYERAYIDAIADGLGRRARAASEGAEGKP